MLVALDENDRLISLMTLERQHFSRLSRQVLRCPACKSQVRFKNGQVKLPHFAHVSLATCQVFSENESAQHLALKRRLYHWFSQTEQVEIEQYLPDLQQTPDLLVNGALAIEIQCSSLSISRLRDRTATYQAHGYTVLWLMGQDLWLGESLTQLKQHFLYYSANAGFYYWELDLAQTCLRLKSLIHEDLRGQLYYVIQTFAFDCGQLLAILRQPFAARTAQLMVNRLPHVQHYIARQLYYQNPKWLKIQACFYENGLNLLTLTDLPTSVYPIGLNRLTYPFEGIRKPDFCQITKDVLPYYHHFLTYAKGNIFYPPAYYAKLAK